MPLGTHPDRINRIWPYWKNNITGGELVCQEHIFRTSGDIRNSWSSWFSNLASLTPYQDQHHPISRPGWYQSPFLLFFFAAFFFFYTGFDSVHPHHERPVDIFEKSWAYADMLMVGVEATDYAPNVGPPATVAEWRSHFGAWAINSSPLVLSFDLSIDPFCSRSLQ